LHVIALYHFTMTKSPSVVWPDDAWTFALKSPSIRKLWFSGSLLMWFIEVEEFIVYFHHRMKNQVHIFERWWVVHSECSIIRSEISSKSSRAFLVSLSIIMATPLRLIFCWLKGLSIQNILFIWFIKSINNTDYNFKISSSNSAYIKLLLKVSRLWVILSVT